MLSLAAIPRSFAAPDAIFAMTGATPAVKKGCRILLQPNPFLWSGQYDAAMSNLLANQGLQRTSDLWVCDAGGTLTHVSPESNPLV